MKMKPGHWLQYAGVVLIVAGATWLAIVLTQSNSKTPSASAQVHKLRLKLKWLNQAQFAGFYVAQAKGFFAQKGLDVSIEPGPANTPLAVESGAADIGVGGAEQVLINRSEGHEIRAVGVIYQSSPACWMVRADSPIKSLADLTDQTVGVQQPGSDFDILYRATVAKFHLDRSRLHEVAVEASLPAFLQRQVDVLPSYLINEPFVVESKGARVRCIRPSDAGLDFYGDTLLISDALLRERGEDVRAFLSASIQGWSYALQHIDEAVKITRAVNPDLPQDSQIYMLQQSISLIDPNHSPLFIMSRERWEAMEKILVELGLMHAIPIDQAFTNCFLPMP